MNREKMKKKLSFNKLLRYSFAICFILSFGQIVILPFVNTILNTILIKLLFEPIPKKEFDNALTKVCNKNQVKEADKDSLISMICLNKNIFSDLN